MSHYTIIHISTEELHFLKIFTLMYARAVTNYADNNFTGYSGKNLIENVRLQQKMT